jgi:hypothetical protein
MELFQASNQWANRPEDERFSNLKDLYEATLGYFLEARSSVTPYSDLKVEPNGGGELYLTGKTGAHAKFTNWSFGQLCNRLQAPTSYLQKLSPALAAENLNYGLSTKNDLTDANMLLRQGVTDLTIRSITSDRYTRIWDHEIVSSLARNLEFCPGWRVPPARPTGENTRGARPATKEDLLEATQMGLSIKEGDMIAPAGLYASDHDVFIFMINEQNRINDGSEGGLSRGFFISNSEVGAASFKFTTFLLRWVCGNHIVWGASNVKELSIRHVGKANSVAFDKLEGTIKEYSDESASDLEGKLKVARQKEIAATKEELFDIIFKTKLLSRQNIESAYQLAEINENQDGNPRSFYGFSQGVTRLSQAIPHMDKRVEMDRAAGKILEMAF